MTDRDKLCDILPPELLLHQEAGSINSRVAGQTGRMIPVQDLGAWLLTRANATTPPGPASARWGGQALTRECTWMVLLEMSWWGRTTTDSPEWSAGRVIRVTIQVNGFRQKQVRIQAGVQNWQNLNKVIFRLENHFWKRADSLAKWECERCCPYRGRQRWNQSSWLGVWSERKYRKDHTGSDDNFKIRSPCTSSYFILFQTTKCKVYRFLQKQNIFHKFKNPGSKCFTLDLSLLWNV